MWKKETRIWLNSRNSKYILDIRMNVFTRFALRLVFEVENGTLYGSSNSWWLGFIKIRNMIMNLKKSKIYIIVKNPKEAYKNNVLDASHGCKDPRASVNGACREKFKFANCAKDCKIFSRE